MNENVVRILRKDDMFEVYRNKLLYGVASTSIEAESVAEEARTAQLRRLS